MAPGNRCLVGLLECFPVNLDASTQVPADSQESFAKWPVSSTRRMKATNDILAGAAECLRLPEGIVRHLAEADGVLSQRSDGVEIFKPDSGGEGLNMDHAGVLRNTTSPK